MSSDELRTICRCCRDRFDLGEGVKMASAHRLQMGF